MIEKEIISSFH